MLYRNEVFFVQKMVSALKLLNVESIPFSNKKFEDGVQKMADYLKVTLDPDDFEEISLLFIKRPIQDSFDRLVDAMMSLNGSAISFSLQNPYWEKATIHMNEEKAKKYLDSSGSLALDSEQITAAAKVFCEGAGISYNEYTTSIERQCF